MIDNIKNFYTNPAKVGNFLASTALSVGIPVLIGAPLLPILGGMAASVALTTAINWAKYFIIYKPVLNELPEGDLKNKYEDYVWGKENSFDALSKELEPDKNMLDAGQQDPFAEKKSEIKNALISGGSVSFLLPKELTGEKAGEYITEQGFLEINHHFFNKVWELDLKSKLCLATSLFGALAETYVRYNLLNFKMLQPDLSLNSFKALAQTMLANTGFEGVTSTLSAALSQKEIPSFDLVGNYVETLKSAILVNCISLVSKKSRPPLP